MSNELSDAERMTKIETQMENVLQIVTKMDAKMDAWQASFVSKELLEEKLKYLYERLERLEEEKKSKKTLAPHWVATTLAAISLAFTILMYAWSRK